MSHIVTIKTEVRDGQAVQAACARLGVPTPTTGTFKLYGSEATGLGVQLPDWSYPVVCDLTTGQLKYDNFNGYWGNPVCLDRFLQSYAVERARFEAAKQGHRVTEQTLADGSIKLTVQVGGAA
jgi:hypothetical protein